MTKIINILNLSSFLAQSIARLTEEKNVAKFIYHGHRLCVQLTDTVRPLECSFPEALSSSPYLFSTKM